MDLVRIDPPAPTVAHNQDTSPEPSHNAQNNTRETRARSDGRGCYRNSSGYSCKRQRPKI